MEIHDFNWNELNIESKAKQTDKEETDLLDGLDFNAVKRVDNVPDDNEYDSEKYVVKKQRSPGFYASMRALSLFIMATISVFVMVFVLINTVPALPSESLRNEIIEKVSSNAAVYSVFRFFSTDKDFFDSEKEQSLQSTENVEPPLSSYCSFEKDPVTVVESVNNTELIEVNYGIVTGTMLVVKDPSTISLSTIEDFTVKTGLDLARHVAVCNGVAGINAGSFVESSGRNTEAAPVGIIIKDGAVVYGNSEVKYNLVGFDKDGKLYAENSTGSEALSCGVVNAVTCTSTEITVSLLLISNGEKQISEYRYAVSPRTVIGQRADGTVLMLVLEGDCVKSLGANLDDVCSIMLTFGAEKAALLDCSTAAEMIYEGEIVAGAGTVNGAVQIPTAFVIVEEGE